MPMPRAAILSLALILEALTAHAQTTDSPFLPAGSGGQEAPADNNAVLELRGIVVEPTGPIFNLVDASTKKGVWVGLNETGHEFVVTGYEGQEGNESASVSYRGQSLRLQLAKGKIGAAAPGVAPTGAVAAGRPIPAQPPISPVVLNPTPADEARRLEAVASELRRRREQRQLERQQAKQPQNQLPPPAPASGQANP